MPRVRFIGPEESCVAFGATFRRMRWRGRGPLSPAQLETLAANPTFEVEKHRPGPRKAAGAPAED